MVSEARVEEPAHLPGFFGKLPAHGDFIGRRLPQAVRRRFDDWLQEGLVQSRMDLGADWLPLWLSSPLWRFTAARGVFGEQAWAGVMMPSHDRVGRCFPLVLAAGLAGHPSLRDCMTRHGAWFTRLEDLALSTLEPGFTLHAFDQEVRAMGEAPHDAALAPCFPGSARTSQSATVRAYDAEFAATACLLPGASAWWSSGSARVAPCLAMCAGLPSASGFAALLDGRWEERGWLVA